jgi:hypothetical protein
MDVLATCPNPRAHKSSDAVLRLVILLKCLTSNTLVFQEDIITLRKSLASGYMYGPTSFCHLRHDLWISWYYFKSLVLARNLETSDLLSVQMGSAPQQQESQETYARTRECFFAPHTCDIVHAGTLKRLAYMFYSDFSSFEKKHWIPCICTEVRPNAVSEYCCLVFWLLVWRHASSRLILWLLVRFQPSSCTEHPMHSNIQTHTHTSSFPCSHRHLPAFAISHKGTHN